ncbi:DUF6603 domain-containing protein [Streptomyces sp. G1]|uniref:DUF6603 domain-containing protein n=1 Tax=Streptomyces sp. G1 TaxID=361572 RepID=UPI0020300207|nr:DUF6603 domain-containing protein [Streptomyces sp. G1]MCM1965098.1 hypothetical protein [Streptomyces sp. G1]
MTDDPGKPANAAGATGWKTIDRQLGPLHVRRIGAGLHEKKVWLLFDADLVFSGLSLATDGLGLGLSPAVIDGKAPDLTGTLKGLAVGYDSAALTVAGAVESRTPASGFDLDLAGGLVVRTEKFSLEALGSFRHATTGWFSLDVLGVLGAQLGEPPVFVVTHLAGGFGYNSKLRIPSLADVPNFPLLKAVQGGDLGSGTGSGGAAGGDEAGKLLGVLEQLRGDGGWITPSRGSFWAAAGLTFTAFEMITGEAVLALGLGGEVSLTLAGHANASFPSAKDVPAADGVRRYAEVDLDVLVGYRSSTHLFTARAQLTDQSYVLSRDCRLTGGMALDVWTGGPHGGDFVLTVGGYPDGYRVPAHYPAVDRVGVTWSPDSSVAVTGGAYCALTPHAIMAGGEIHIAYHSGSLRAWLDAGVHALVAWAPFHFDAGIRVSVGVQYTAHVLGWDITIGVHLMVGVDVWGPPTGGSAHAEVAGIHITVDFGEGRRAAPAPLDWTSFRHKLLPEKTLFLTPLAGINQPGAAESAGTWHAAAHGIRFSMRSAVPATSATLCGQPVDLKGTPVGLDIRPVGVTQAHCAHAVDITYHGDDGTRGPVSAKAWTVRAVQGQVPAALWGRPDGSGPALVPGHGLGMELTLRTPQLVNATEVPAGVLTHGDDLTAPLPLRP